MSDRVVVVDTGYGEYDQERTILEEAGYPLEIAENAFTREEKIASAKGAAGIFVRGIRVNGDLLDQLPGLRAIVRYGVGYDNVDVGAATERGVKVANVRGYANHAVSDHALTLIYACLRGLNVARQLVTTQYGELPHSPIPAVKDITLGILGLGNIGGTLAYKARHL